MQIVANTAPRRLFRWMCCAAWAVVAMLLVNYPGSWDHVFAPLEHSEWNDHTTDLIFPHFLFVVGVSVRWACARGSLSSTVVARIAVGGSGHGSVSGGHVGLRQSALPRLG